MKHLFTILLVFMTSYCLSFAQQGESCDDPIIASLGQNQFTKNDQNDLWYKYTTDSEGFLTIGDPGNSNAPNIIYEVYSDCNTNITGSQYGLALPVKANTVYYLRTQGFEIENANWNLSLRAFVKGEDCSLPLTAATGTNVAEWNATDFAWYKYTATLEGLSIIESSSHFEVFTECGNSKPKGSYKKNYNTCVYRHDYLLEVSKKHYR